MKVLRVWLDGQSTASTKGTQITSFPDLEPNSIGTFDDTVLNLMDDFMIDSHARGIKVPWFCTHILTLVANRRLSPASI